MLNPKTAPTGTVTAARPTVGTARQATAIDAHVGARIRFGRRLLGLSQENLADQLGLTFQQVQKYENGTNRISASRLFAVARALSVPVLFFFVDTSGVAEAGGMTLQLSDDFPHNRDAFELNKAFMKIADYRVREAVMELVRNLADR